MRFTSKILIGVFIAMLILSACVITCLASYYENDFKKGKTLGDKQEEMELPSNYKVLLLTTDIPKEWEDRLYAFQTLIEGNIEIKQSEKRRGHQFWVTQELKPYLIQTINKDTLSLSLDYEKLYSQYFDNGFGKIKGLNFTIYADSVINFVNRMPGVNISVKGLSAKQVDLYTLVGKMDIQNSNFETITLSGYRDNHNELVLKKCNIETLNLDLNNRIWAWKNENLSGCNIDVINISGEYDKESRYYYYNEDKSLEFSIPENFCKTVNWLPKDDSTKFKLEIITEIGRPTSFSIPQ